MTGLIIPEGQSQDLSGLIEINKVFNILWNFSLNDIRSVNHEMMVQDEELMAA